jgi:DNA-binding NarL/FixJ family response regulator
MAIRLLVCDDHEVIRSGMVTILAGSEIEVVAQAANGNEALEQVEAVKPDVVLLDIRMPGSDGLATLEKIKSIDPDVKVVMLSTYDNPTYVARSVALGASDYILKGASRDDLIATITAVTRGESPTRSGELRRVAGAMRIRQVLDDDEVPLTQRETQVLRHVALGLSNKEIGRSLEISVETVKEHVQNILRKIAVSDRTQAAVWAVRRGLV